jgi:ech hydrogenase subunit A
MPLITVLFAVGSAATLGFWARWLGRLFTSPPGVVRARVQLGPIYALTLGPLVAAIGVLSLAAGLIVDRFLEPGMRLYLAGDALSETGVALVSAGSSSFPIGWLFAVVVVALGLPALAVAIKPGQLRPVYMCGENVGGPSS